VRESTTDDIFLIVGLAMIAYGFWDMTRLILVFGGTLIIFVILNGRPDDGSEGKTI